MRPTCLALLFLTLAACSKAPTPPPHRVTLERTGGTTFHLVPTADQHPFCLAWTFATTGPTRQLTMSPKNLSFECPAGQPIGRHDWRVPVTDGPVKVLVLFTSQAVNAGSVSQQLVEKGGAAKVSVMDLRLPGSATLEVLDFTPEADVAAQEGAVLGGDAGAP